MYNTFHFNSHKNGYDILLFGANGRWWKKNNFRLKLACIGQIVSGTTVLLSGEKQHSSV